MKLISLLIYISQPDHIAKGIHISDGLKICVKCIPKLGNEYVILKHILQMQDKRHPIALPPLNILEFGNHVLVVMRSLLPLNVLKINMYQLKKIALGILQVCLWILNLLLFYIYCLLSFQPLAFTQF